MPNPLRRVLLLAVLCLSVCVPAAVGSAAAGDGLSRADITVRDLETGQVTLTGELTVARQGDRETRDIVYRDKTRTVQTEHVVYAGPRLRVLDYALHNSVLGYDAALKSDGSSFSMRYRESASDAFRELHMDWGPDDYHPAVIDMLVLRNWAKLLKGEPMDFDLLIPQKGASVGMEIAYRGERALDGGKIAVFQMQPKFGMLRMIMPHIEYNFSAGAEPALRQYIGPGPFPGSREIVDVRYAVHTP